MATPIFSTSPAQGSLAFLFYVSISLVLAAAIYLLLRRPDLWRPEWRPLVDGPISRRWALVSCLTAALPLLVHGYVESWQHYVSLDIHNDRLVVTYLFPKRTYEIAAHARLAVSAETEARKAAQYRIRLMEVGGREHTSQLMNRRQLDVNLAALNEALSRYRDRQPAPFEGDENGR